MSYAEFLDMLLTLVTLSEENFKKYEEYVRNSELPQNERMFLECSLEIAKKERQSVNA